MRYRLKCLTPLLAVTSEDVENRRRFHSSSSPASSGSDI